MAAKSEGQGRRASRAVRWTTDTGTHATQVRRGGEEGPDADAGDATNADEEGASLHESLVADAEEGGLSAREAGARVSAKDMPEMATVGDLRERERRKAWRGLK